MRPRSVWRGRPYPLGATWDGQGVNFALYSEHAERVELCLFDARGRREIERIALGERSGFVWHAYLPEARPGQLYAYRVQGPAGPQHRFNPNKLLLDPYSRLIVGTVYAGLGRSQVIDPAFTWGGDRAPRIPWERTVIYEAHVKGFTRLNAAVPEALRGTYAGLASAPAIEHLKRLGVTAVELLPIHAIADEKRLVQHGLRNYWGYSSIGYFAPEMRYSSQIAERGTVSEFKTMVKTLHSAGIEVILDVVYNHTGEGDHHGPTLSFRGIDNAVYYRLDLQDPRRYVDYTGTGNSLNTRHPAVVQLVLDSLRYWVQEMHVDGFRFDLATTLARGAHGYDRAAAFLAAVRQDPVLAPVKLIAEPWDIGEGGYQLGAFPPGWSEWNDKYRDVMRSYWKGDGGLIGQFAARLAGSADIYGHGGRSATASVNYVTAHDGFTLHDLVSYERKRNEANLEQNRDGSDSNRSWNCGVEGPTDDAQVKQLRERQKRNFLATLLFSQGVPMLVAGDEMGRTQRGNNNAYCQDGELSWVDWDLDEDGQRLLEFARRVIALRASHPLLSRRAFPNDIVWLSPQGGTMTESDWKLPFARCLGALHPGARQERDDYGVGVEDDDLLLLFNAHHAEVPFALPGERDRRWDVVVDTVFADGVPQVRSYGASATYPLQGRSLALLTRAR